MSSSSSKPRKPTVTNIGGIPIEFLFQPYGSHISFMSRVIATLDRAQRDGHFHALLELPTGTGKSFSLLCSVIA
ncbi:fanconi anemia group J protein, partial [Tanacetum coccineum]